MIYTPRVCTDMIEEQATWPSPHRSVCTKIDFKGYEISISMDSSHGPGDLCRTDIRIYQKDADVTSMFCAADEFMLYGNAETLLRVMKQIESGSVN